MHDGQKLFPHPAGAEEPVSRVVFSIFKTIHDVIPKRTTCAVEDWFGLVCILLDCVQKEFEMARYVHNPRSLVSL